MENQIGQRHTGWARRAAAPVMSQPDLEAPQDEGAGAHLLAKPDVPKKAMPASPAPLAPSEESKSEKALSACGGAGRGGAGRAAAVEARDPRLCNAVISFLLMIVIGLGNKIFQVQGARRMRKPELHFAWGVAGWRELWRVGETKNRAGQVLEFIPMYNYVLFVNLLTTFAYLPTSFAYIYFMVRAPQRGVCWWR